MQPDAAAFGALGIPPGSSPMEVEAAYRRLIKLHHPDRGGDPHRAAEINSAYQQLQRRFARDLARRSGPPVPVRPAPRRKPRRRRQWALVLGVAVAVVLISERQAVADWIGDYSLPVISPARTAMEAQPRRRAVDLAQAPLDLAGIDRSVFDAGLIAATGGEERLAQQSFACHHGLRRNPDPSRLDRCVAFDEAAVAMLGRGPFDSGPFGASAMTARHFASGHLLSSDTLALESRLSRIREQVALNLAPPDPPPPALAASAD